MRDNEAPRAIRLADYRVPDFLVDHAELYVDIRDPLTRVTTELQLRRNPASADPGAPLRLDGEGIALIEVRMDGKPLPADGYRLEARALVLEDVPDRFVLRTVGDIDPLHNTALEGLYVSHGMYCTQCEAEGFRRITWYPDRPDVMAGFRTTIEADRQRFPLLLSNGNPVAREELAAGRHRVTWDDPFPKPCYLFALVAGDLACREDEFVTCSGRRVALRIYVEPHDLDKTAHGMDSLKRAMRWDEEVYGREYDLDIYMIVAVSHFNMGAMENKGLNVFNTSCVLANPRTQTDKAFQRVEAVIAHEYFHNWSGNRVTCRDWFQLSLKEGFTVFRDAEFSKDMHSRTVKRIEEVNFLRSVQFAEDASPLAHPVRPDSYVEINNFYTVTVYEKGAEVVRMLHTILGPDVFRRGCDLYFARHDGQAVTCEDFVLAMEEASGRDLQQFRRWYSQAGTPQVDVALEFDPATGTCRLRFRQSSPVRPGQPAAIATNKPFVIPIRFGLLERATGYELPVRTGDPRVTVDTQGALFLFDTEQAELVFEGLKAAPLPSLLRGFSAPVRIRFPYGNDELAYLARRDTDAFNRWDAAQGLYVGALLEAALAHAGGREPVRVPDAVLALFGSVLEKSGDDPALAAEMINLPSESYLADQMEVADPAAVRAARQEFRRQLARHFRQPLMQSLGPQPAWSFSPDAVSRRAFSNAVLDLLSAVADEDVTQCVLARYRQADNMTDQMGALRAAVNGGMPAAAGLLQEFRAQWQQEALVIDQWFSLQVSSPEIDAIQRAEILLADPGFELTNPNRVRALIGGLCGNTAEFHRPDGAGYEFLATQLLALDAVNPQIAARLAGAFSRWRRVAPALQAHAARAMDRILAGAPLSPNLYEVIHKTRFDGAG